MRLGAHYNNKYVCCTYGSKGTHDAPSENRKQTHIRYFNNLVVSQTATAMLSENKNKREFFITSKNR